MEKSLTYEERICQCDFIWERFEKIYWVLKITRYTNFKIRISEGQKDKLTKAFECNCESITIRFKFSDLHGEEVIALVERLDILMASKAAGITGVRNELVSVCDELLRQNLIDKHKYKIIMLQL